MTGFKSVLETVPATLPAYEQLSEKQKLILQNGWRWPEIAPVIEKTREELDEAAQAIAGGNRAEMVDELGDLVFMATLLCHYAGVDPQEAVRSATHKLERRFGYIERRAYESGRSLKDVPHAEERAWYNDYKSQEKQGALKGAA